MRTTLQIDDDLYRAVKSIATAENKSVGQVVSTMLRKAIFLKEYADDTGDIPSFRVSENASPLTTEMVGEADEDTIR